MKLVGLDSAVAGPGQGGCSQGLGHVTYPVDCLSVQGLAVCLGAHQSRGPGMLACRLMKDVVLAGLRGAGGRCLACLRRVR